MLFVWLPGPPRSCPPRLWCGSLAWRQPRLAVVVHFHLIHHIKTDNQKVITVAWHQCLPQEDRVIEHHRREESRLSQGHAVMNVRCRHKSRGSGSRGTETWMDRLTAEVGRLIRVHRWTKRTVWEKKVREVNRQTLAWLSGNWINTLTVREEKPQKSQVWLAL